MKRVLLLTGSTGLFGSEFIRCHGERYAIAGVARHPPADAVRATQPPYDFLAADIRTDAARIVEWVLERHGRIDVLVNNAYTYRPRSLVDDVTDDLRAELDTNLVAPLELAATVARRFWKEQPPGENLAAKRNVLNLSSTSSLHVYPGQGLYGPTKAALNALTRYMAAEYRPLGVRANALAPTTFPTLVPTKLVADTAAEIDESDLVGKIVVLERNGAKYLV